METIKDIVCDMREEGHTGPSCCLEWVGAKLRAYADRIEAAYKFENLMMNAEKGWYCYHYREQTKKTIALDHENAKLKAALKPVLDIVMDDATSDLAMAEAIDEAHRIYNEGASK